mmetsp:Transcript_3588/g.7262  ORF Transcript_3588/g.7262 Transcript_3588/m.7262 type:complete len:431 (-) Transcript_3588:2281-3573(-)
MCVLCVQCSKHLLLLLVRRWVCVLCLERSKHFLLLLLLFCLLELLLQLPSYPTVLVLVLGHELLPWEAAQLVELRISNVVHDLEARDLRRDVHDLLYHFPELVELESAVAVVIVHPDKVLDLLLVVAHDADRAKVRHEVSNVERGCGRGLPAGAKEHLCRPLLQHSLVASRPDVPCDLGHQRPCGKLLVLEQHLSQHGVVDLGGSELPNAEMPHHDEDEERYPQGVHAQARARPREGGRELVVERAWFLHIGRHPVRAPDLHTVEARHRDAGEKWIQEEKPEHLHVPVSVSHTLDAFAILRLGQHQKQGRDGEQKRHDDWTNCTCLKDCKEGISRGQTAHAREAKKIETKHGAHLPYLLQLAGPFNHHVHLIRARNLPKGDKNLEIIHDVAVQPPEQHIPHLRLHKTHQTTKPLTAKTLCRRFLASFRLA